MDKDNKALDMGGKMKITVEIKDNTLVYSYEIGEGNHNSSRPLTADCLLIFCKVLEYLQRAKSSDDDMSRDAINSYVFSKVHPELFEKAKKRIKLED